MLHELGHIIDFALVPDDLRDQLAGELPTTGVCLPERGDCAAPEERFADTFAKWALRGDVSIIGAGYELRHPRRWRTGARRSPSPRDVQTDVGALSALTVTVLTTAV